MNYLKISTCSLCDGLGVRVVLWVSGCTHHCEGCHNPYSWNFNNGKAFDDSAFEKLICSLNKPYVKGLTLSGGDPLNERNIDEVTEVARKVKLLLPPKDIWCYTGFLWEEVKDYPIMQYIDVLVDSPFIKAQRDISLAFKGSSNQNIINVAASIKEGRKVILL